MAGKVSSRYSKNVSKQRKKGGYNSARKVLITPDASNSSDDDNSIDSSIPYETNRQSEEAGGKKKKNPFKKLGKLGKRKKKKESFSKVERRSKARDMIFAAAMENEDKQAQDPGRFVARNRTTAEGDVRDDENDDVEMNGDDDDEISRDGGDIDDASDHDDDDESKYYDGDVSLAEYTVDLCNDSVYIDETGNVDVSAAISAPFKTIDDVVNDSAHIDETENADVSSAVSAAVKAMDDIVSAAVQKVDRSKDSDSGNEDIEKPVDECVSKALKTSDCSNIVDSTVNDSPKCVNESITNIDVLEAVRAIGDSVSAAVDTIDRNRYGDKNIAIDCTYGVDKVGNDHDNTNNNNNDDDNNVDNEDDNNVDNETAKENKSKINGDYYARVRFNLGLVNMKDGELDMARDHLNRSLRAWKHINGRYHDTVANAHEKLGDVAVMMDNYNEVHLHYNACLRIKQPKKDEESQKMVSNILVKFAEFLLEKEEKSSAVECFNDALPYIRRKKGDKNRKELTALLFRIGHLYVDLDDGDNAAKYFTEASDQFLEEHV